MKEKSRLKSFMDSLERNFAAVGLAEGDPSIAREYLDSVEKGHGSSFIKVAGRNLGKLALSFQTNFAVVGLAEGDPDLAREYLKEVEGTDRLSFTERLVSRIKQVLMGFENRFAAAAMAEGGPELAVEYLESGKTQEKRPTFLTFIKEIGLQDIRVQYGVAALSLDKAS